MNDELKALLSRIGNTVPFLGVDLIDPNQRGNFDTTPLSISVSWGDVRAVLILLDAGADVNAKLEYAETPLHEAARTDNVEIVKLLLSRGARTDAVSEFGKTPLDVALSRDKPLSNDQQNIVSLLSRASAPKQGP
jgi:ankyrin repeat protein